MIEELSSGWHIVKMAVVVTFMWAIASCTTGCGIRAGRTVIGTSGFLEQVNAGREVELSGERHSKKDKRRLARIIEGS